MFNFIRQVLIVVLSFSGSLVQVIKVSDQTKCLSLSDKLCMVRSTFIDLNPIELKYYPVMISLYKCNGSCNILVPKICVLKKKRSDHIAINNYYYLLSLCHYANHRSK